MRKITAALLILLFLFNLCGYRVFMGYLQDKAAANLDARLDGHLYDDSELVEMKLPMNLPYQTSWAGYQRCYGQLELNGVMYNYVKRKVSNDTLFLMCIPNTGKMLLETAKNDFFEFSFGLSQKDGSKNHGSRLALISKSLQADYDEYSFAVNFKSRFDACKNCWLPSQSENLISFPSLSPEQPPDVVCI